MRKVKPLFITRSCLAELKRRSLCSTRELGWLCAGRKRTILKVFRVRNADPAPTLGYCSNLNEHQVTARKIKLLGMKIYCEAHSHPHPRGLAQPSLGDFTCSTKGEVELIVGVASDLVEVAAWRICSSYRKTIRRGQVPLIVC